MDFREYLAESLQLRTESIRKFCSQPLEVEERNLELIVMRVTHRPDGSLLTIFLLEIVTNFFSLGFEKICLCHLWHRYFLSWKPFAPKSFPCDISTELDLYSTMYLHGSYMLFDQTQYYLFLLTEPWSIV